MVEVDILAPEQKVLAEAMPEFDFSFVCIAHDVRRPQKALSVLFHFASPSRVFATVVAFAGVEFDIQPWSKQAREGEKTSKSAPLITEKFFCHTVP